MWRADDNDLDRAIDASARRMTLGDADASLRARVIERLDENGARHRWTSTSGRRWVWMLSPVALAAIVVVAMLVGVWRRPIAPSRVADRATTTATPSVVAPRPVPANDRPAALTQAAPSNDVNDAGAASFRRARNRVDVADRSASTPQSVDLRAAASASDNALPDSFAQPPLENDPIAVGAILAAPIAPAESIAVDPLPVIAPIAVAPLGAGEQR
jgi:hypothetical protein